MGRGKGDSNSHTRHPGHGFATMASLLAGDTGVAECTAGRTYAKGSHRREMNARRHSAGFVFDHVTSFRKVVRRSISQIMNQA